MCTNFIFRNSLESIDWITPHGTMFRKMNYEITIVDLV